MRRRFDMVSLVAGLALCGLGLLVLLDQVNAIHLAYGVAAPAVLAAIGAVLLASGLDRDR